LSHGAGSLLLRLDPTGAAGVAVGAMEDLGQVLDGVLLDVAPVALDAGFLGAEAANGLAGLAKGAPEARPAFHPDPLSAVAAPGVSEREIGGHVAAAAETAARRAGAYPRASLFQAWGRVVHKAGGAAPLELGVMAAAAVAYLRAGDAAGL